MWLFFKSAINDQVKDHILMKKEKEINNKQWVNQD